jgi:hypothetical protein
MVVWFFDDNAANIAAFRKHHPDVRSVLVERNPHTCPANMEDHCARVLEQHADNRFAASVLSGGRSHYEVGSGVSPADVDRVLLGPRPTAVLLDWDLTLSACNGLELNPLMPPKMVLDAAVFYAGGLERFAALRETLRRLRASGARVVVLTDNATAKHPLDRREFLRLLRCFDPNFADRDLVYGWLDKARVYAEEILPLLKRRNPLRRAEPETTTPWTARPALRTAAAKKRTANASKSSSAKTRRFGST